MASIVDRLRIGRGLGMGTAVLYLSLIVLIPLTAVASAIVAVVNGVLGTVVAWVLVRDSFPGRTAVDTLIDLPFALPTIVAGLVLLALYGVNSPLHLDIAYTRLSVVVALLFVTLPFVVRTVQPVLQELDREMEQAAYSLGAGRWLTWRRIVLPNLLPAMLSGAGLAFTRAIAEYGSTNLISGNIPLKTQVAAVNIAGRVESDNTAAAAAVSTVLLVVAFVVLVGLDLVRRLEKRH